MEKQKSAGWKFEYCLTFRSQNLTGFATVCDHPTAAASRFTRNRVSFRAAGESRITLAQGMLSITTHHLRRQSSRKVRAIHLMPFFLLLFLGRLAFPQSADRLDDCVQAYVRNGDFSGSVLIAQKSRVVFHKSYGMASYELSVPNSEKIKFHIASLSKTFTAAAIVMLAGQGKLKYSDPLSRYIPGYLNGDQVTLEQLLTHRSGVPDYYSLPEYAAKKFQPVSLPELIAWVKTKPLDFIPGTDTRYSNTGYAFLAYVIEQLSGKSYERFLHEEILAPAGMHDTGTARDDLLIPGRAEGYQPWTGTPPLRKAPAYDKTILTGAGSLYSTTNDLYAWYRVLRGGRFFELGKLPYPYGWDVRETEGGKKYLEKDGRIPGFVSNFSLFLDEDLVVILLGNLEDAAVNSMAKDLVAIALGATVPSPPPRPQARAPVPQVQDYSGVYQVAPGFLLDVRDSASNLYLRGTGGDYLPLEHVGKDAFFYRQLYVKVNFKRDRRARSKLFSGTATTYARKSAPRRAPERQVSVAGALRLRQGAYILRPNAGIVPLREKASSAKANHRKNRVQRKGNKKAGHEPGARLLPEI